MAESNELIVRDQSLAFSRLASGELSADEIAELSNAINVVKEKAKELSEHFEGAMIAMLRQQEADGGKAELMIGDIRYYLGNPPSYKARNPAELVNEIIVLSAGDMDAACRDFMAATPFKPGAIREALEGAGRPGRFDELFDTIRKPELKEGKPHLQKADKKFVKPRRRREEDGHVEH